MRIITINVPDQYIQTIEDFCEIGLYNSRSQFVREALGWFLNKIETEGGNLDVEEYSLILKVLKDAEK